MENRSAWSAAGAAVAAISGTNAVAWASAASPSGSALPLWPAFAFGAIALVGIFGTIAPLARIWPFHALRSPAEILDEQMRLGHDARERLVRLGLSEKEARLEYVRWFIRTGTLLERYVPAIADEFTLASADETRFSGQVLVVQLINAKLGVLKAARRDL
jgi:hypothetical protein